MRSFLELYWALRFLYFETQSPEEAVKRLFLKIS